VIQFLAVEHRGRLEEHKLHTTTGCGAARPTKSPCLDKLDKQLARGSWPYTRGVSMVWKLENTTVGTASPSGVLLPNTPCPMFEPAITRYRFTCDFRP
jgi:hypothetical protein